ncbi:MAG TPA: hypothetical protein VE173_06580, partial [Longimicrobiales bacterium]|nr:hypothetical protein [Longimicrobiales bacterium]
PGTAVRAQDGRNPELREWTVPWDGTRPRDPYVGPEGQVWFVGQAGHYVAALNPDDGEFQRFDLDDGTGPHNLIVGDDGIVWYAGNAAGHIGRLDPATGEIRKFMMPDERARDPHTLLWAPDGSIWFTVQQGNFVGHLDPASGEVRLVEMPQAEGRGGRMTSSRPYGIQLDSEGRPWVALFNTNRIATIDPETFEPRFFDLPEGTRPRRLVVDSSDRIWYVDYAQGQLGRLIPGTGQVAEWPTPGGDDSRPYGMAIDAADRIWFVETGPDPNRFVGFDPGSEEFFSTVEVESGGGTVRNMYYDASANTIWFGTDANTVGRAVLPPPRRGIS